MARKLGAGRLIVASHNPGKLREIDELVAPYGIATVSAGALGLPEPEETGTTFIANALIKAHASSKGANAPALSDDSGLVVNAMGGEPGIYSARWAGPTKDFAIAMRKVEDRLQAICATRQEQRRAHFVSALALVWPDGHEEIFEGRVFGTLVWPPRGAQGFGYDPMFLPDGETLTFGEMDSTTKHGMSHRARAFALLVEACLKR